MPGRKIEGDWILGWPDRKRPCSEFYKDAEGRVVFSRSPFLGLEGLLTPTDAHYIVARATDEAGRTQPLFREDSLAAVLSIHSLQELRRWTPEETALGRSAAHLLGLLIGATLA